VHEGRTRLQQYLRERGIRYWKSQANFVLLHIGARHAEFVSLMREHGILIRDRNSDPGCIGCVRITIGTREQMNQLSKVLDEVIAALEIGSAEALR
jgi:histidinol-phosphate aminotransferase